MTTTRALVSSERTPLSRDRILDAALRYIDEHGLDALSMHKLGAELGVKAMSLYNHVTNKGDLLDGIVETLWTEVEDTAPPDPDWRTGYRLFAHALRDTMHRHPHAAPLITTQQTMPEPSLRTIQAHIGSATDSGLPEEDAYALLRTITSYALGYALAYLSWDTGRPGCEPSVSAMLAPGTPDELAGVAEIFCGQADADAEFELGLDLMLRGTTPGARR